LTQSLRRYGLKTQPGMADAPVPFHRAAEIEFAHRRATL
jgi:hypothetical protein